MSNELEETPVEKAVETDELRLRRLDKRIEDWLSQLRAEANERSPEVLGAMAAKVNDLGKYLEKMADQARSRLEGKEIPAARADEPGPTPEQEMRGAQPRSDDSSGSRAVEHETRPTGKTADVVDLDEVNETGSGRSTHGANG
jgi:hypothetical protein